MPVSNLSRRAFSRITPTATVDDPLTRKLNSILIGQPKAIETIVPYVQMYQSGLAPEGRPVGVFMLLGPTGTGKTRTVEALAETLHGSAKKMIRVDCGEYQLDHEVAKLVGSPPGYLGHRETVPVLCKPTLAAAASDSCSISIVLFDEVEKSAASLTRLLLGILDKATLRLGDNTTVNFENSLIFMTSNLGAKQMAEAATSGFGLARSLPKPEAPGMEKNEAITKSAMKARFSPEFINRIDETLTYQSLDHATFAAILDNMIVDMNVMLEKRIGGVSGAGRAPKIQYTVKAKELLLTKGVSTEYGGRFLKRTVHRHLIQPFAQLILQRQIPPGSTVVLDARGDKFHFLVRQ